MKQSLYGTASMHCTICGKVLCVIRRSVVFKLRANILHRLWYKYPSAYFKQCILRPTYDLRLSYNSTLGRYPYETQLSTYE
eukprot:scaffold9992_cov185-Chaetoceros_neogracile.AAC.1